MQHLLLEEFILKHTPVTESQALMMYGSLKLSTRLVGCFACLATISQLSN